MRKIGSILLVFALVCFSVFPAYAEPSPEGVLKQKANFTQWMGKGFQSVIGYSFGASCPNTDDQLHYANRYLDWEEEKSGAIKYRCQCAACGSMFNAYESDLKQSYDNQVAELPESTITQDSLYTLYFRDFVYGTDAALGNDSMFYVTYVFSALHNAPKCQCTYINNGGYGDILARSAVLHVPVSGAYRLYDFVSPRGLSYTSNSNMNYFRLYKGTFDSYDRVSISSLSDGYIFSLEAGDYFVYFSTRISCSSSGSTLSASPRLVLVGRDGSSGSVSNVYNSNSRPTAITGGNYGIVGDNGEITTITNNNQIVNETNNTYYNPATGETKPILDWSYDYGDRTYTLGLEGGDTYTVTYGDENITIKEGDTNYTIYYVVNGSGSGGECSHEWYQTGAVKGDCITPAQRTYTCKLCNKQYTETDPVLGHVWLTKQTVPTQYDDDGNLIQAGYTIYECNRCGELYTSSGGVDPPSGGGSSTPGTSVCPHDWKEILRTEPTCTLSGQIVFSCSKCGSTRSEILKAKGHTWQVERTVQTSYDEEGNLVQQGYTIYQCAVCAEQYKDTQGTGPPGDFGSGGDSDGESIWDKIGNFIGSILGGLIGMVEAVLGKLLDALTALSEMLMDKLKAVVETVLTVFDEVPKLFGGFLDFLGVVFPYIPSEITLLLTFGIIAVTFIGIIKALRR